MESVKYDSFLFGFWPYHNTVYAILGRVVGREEEKELPKDHLLCLSNFFNRSRYSERYVDMTAKKIIIKEFTGRSAALWL